MHTIVFFLLQLRMPVEPFWFYISVYTSNPIEIALTELYNQPVKIHLELKLKALHVKDRQKCCPKEVSHFDFPILKYRDT